tara:strand:- start:7817 stop:7969 length:153 start_codon:yes stop_codon:yes gene_type:complete
VKAVKVGVIYTLKIAIMIAKILRFMIGIKLKQDFGRGFFQTLKGTTRFTK